VCFFLWQKKYNSIFYLTSAKTGKNVESAFYDIGLMAMKFAPSRCYIPELYSSEGEIDTRKALDIIQAQVCLELGGDDFASSVLRKQMKDVGINIRKTPTKEQISALIERINDVERTMLDNEEREWCYLKRKGLLSRIRE